MATTQSQGQPQQSSPEQALTWRVWLPRRRPLLSAGVALFIVALTVATALLSDSPFYPVLVLIVLSAAVSGHYVPFRFTLDSEGVTVASMWGRRTKPWDKLKTYWPSGDDCVTVSPSVHRGPLTAARDIYLYSGDNRAEVLQYLTWYLSPAKKSS